MNTRTTLVINIPNMYMQRLTKSGIANIGNIEIRVSGGAVVELFTMRALPIAELVNTVAHVRQNSGSRKDTRSTRKGTSASSQRALAR